VGGRLKVLRERERERERAWVQERSFKGRRKIDRKAEISQKEERFKDE
jgi:hypothetical protein